MRVRPLIGPAMLAAFTLATMMPRHAPAGTVAEQRARLPPPAQCEDDLVQGIWRSHDYLPQWGEWSVFVLEIRRVDGSDKLEGTIVGESWDAGPKQSEPGPCEGAHHRIVSMDAVGSVDDGVITFGGVGQWRLDKHVCGPTGMGYNLDQFTGKLDTDLMEFQSVNNDGGRMVNLPTVFRRVECLPEHKNSAPKRPKVAVTPPSFYPPEDESRGGCQSG